MWRETKREYEQTANTVVTSYSTRFVVNKDQDTGLPAFEKGNLVLYDDFIVEPSNSPTDIPCGTV